MKKNALFLAALLVAGSTQITETRPNADDLGDAAYYTSAAVVGDLCAHTAQKMGSDRNSIPLNAIGLAASLIVAAWMKPSPYVRVAALASGGEFALPLVKRLIKKLTQVWND